MPTTSISASTPGNNTWSIDETARDQWYTSLIKDVIDNQNEEDNDDEWNSDHTRNGYRIWRYVTENTIPGINNQENGISTGIVFKGKSRQQQMLPNHCKTLSTEQLAILTPMPSFTLIPTNFM